MAGFGSPGSHKKTSKAAIAAETNPLANRRRRVGLPHRHSPQARLRPSVNSITNSPNTGRSSSSTCASALAAAIASPVACACVTSASFWWTAAQAVTSTRGVAFNVAKRNSAMAGIAKAMYSAKTALAHHFSAGSLRPFHPGTGKTLRR